MIDKPIRKPFRFQFSLRTLLIVVAVLAVPLGLIGNRIARVQRQKAIVEPLMKYPFARIAWKNGHITSFTTDDLRASVLWAPGTKFPIFQDGDLAILAKLKRLRHINLTVDNDITDNGLASLVKLEKLQSLKIPASTHVSDKGIKHLHKMKHLRRLTLFSDYVSQNGITKLQRALPDCEISVVNISAIRKFILNETPSYPEDDKIDNQ